MSDYVLVTDYEKVEPDDFYLSDDWLKSECPCNMTPEQVREMANEGNLFDAYVVSALNYCIYVQMDAGHVFIDADGDVILHCESAIIGNKHENCVQYDM